LGISLKSSETTDCAILSLHSISDRGVFPDRWNLANKDSFWTCRGLPFRQAHVFTLVICSVGGTAQELERFVLEVIAVNQWCGGTACCVRCINLLIYSQVLNLIFFCQLSQWIQIGRFGSSPYLQFKQFLVPSDQLFLVSN
jgi:hypothetical protein